MEGYLNTIQTIPIVDMTPERKRKLLESIVTVHLDKFKKLNKEQLKEMQIKFKSATSDIELYEKDVGELTGILEQLEKEKEAGIKELEEQLEKLSKELTNTDTEQRRLEKERDKLKAENQESLGLLHKATLKRLLY